MLLLGSELKLIRVDLRGVLEVLGLKGGDKVRLIDQGLAVLLHLSLKKRFLLYQSLHRV